MWYSLTSRIDNGREGLDTPTAENLARYVFKNCYQNTDNLRYGDLENAKSKFLDSPKVRDCIREAASQYRTWIDMIQNQHFSEGESPQRGNAWVEFSCPFNPFSGENISSTFSCKYVRYVNSQSIIVKEPDGNQFKLEAFDAPGLFVAVFFASHFIYCYAPWKEGVGFSSGYRDTDTSSKLRLSNYRNYLFGVKAKWKSDSVEFYDSNKDSSVRSFCIDRIMSSDRNYLRYDDLRYKSTYELESLARSSR